MSITVTRQPERVFLRVPSDQHVFAEVEKWMAAIREIDREEISRERQAAFQALTADYSSSN